MGRYVYIKENNVTIYFFKNMLSGNDEFEIEYL